MPINTKLAKCRCKEALLDRYLVTLVDTEVVIADCGEEDLARSTASPAEDNAEEAYGRRVSLASFAWLARELCNVSQRSRRGHLG